MPRQLHEQALLLIHGQPGSSAEFAPLRRLFSPSRTVLAPDRPGWGASYEPAGGFAYNGAAMARVLDEADVDRALVIGYSWGGGVALAIAEEHPERVAGLVLLSSVGPHSVDWIDRVPLLPGIGNALTTSAFVIARATLSLVGFAQQFGRGNESPGHAWVHALSRSLEGRGAVAPWRASSSSSEQCSTSSTTSSPGSARSASPRSSSPAAVTVSSRPRRRRSSPT